MATKLLYLLLTCLLSSANAQSPQTNITRGSTLYANSTVTFWPSPSGHFAFGFYPSGNSGFRVGIWLMGSPNNTIVWTARRKEPSVSSAASLALQEDGRLVIRDNNGQVQEIAETKRAFVASMLDSGNFILCNSSMEVIWASFNYPKNTLLVGQRLLENQLLYSSESQTNDSIGNFKLWMLGDGNLVAFPLKSFLVPRYFYWSSSSSGIGDVSLNLASDGRLYLQNTSGFSVKTIFEGGFPVNGSILYRVTFDVDGILRLYQHQMGPNGSLNSKILRASINEEDRCGVKGICGLNSYCAMMDEDPACLCPPGFIHIDPKQPNQGCSLNFTIGMDCLEKKVSEYTILSLPNTGWERDEYDLLPPVSTEAECSQSCLEDCDCVVATFRADEMCIKHKLPLRYGKKNSSNPTKTFIKIHEDGPSPSRPGDPSTSSIGKKFLVLGIVLSAFSLIIFLLTGYLIYTHQAWSYKMVWEQANQSSDVTEEINLRSFSYNQLAVATNNFREEIGKGGSGRVYKGYLLENGGKDIAVKRLEYMVEDGENVFKNEMKIIGRTHHKNLVHLIGFCSEGTNRLLVYDYMKNGSLGNVLFRARGRPSWSERMRIAGEIAKGLHYLHEECPTRIIHCDVKPHNILMDESWSAKISDFGLSKLLKPDQTRTYTTPRWTRGYGAPEWYRNNPITVKADVYSFGILLLEIICCRKNMDMGAPEGETLLMDWVYDCYEAGEIQKVVGQEEVNQEELQNLVKIALWCLQTDPALRPTMKSVILMMEGTVASLPPPPIYSVNDN